MTDYIRIKENISPALLASDLNSKMPVECNYIINNGNQLIVNYNTALTAEQESLMDSIIAEHITVLPSIVGNSLMFFGRRSTSFSVTHEWTDVGIDIEEIKDSAFIHTQESAEIEFVRSARYGIKLEVSAQNISADANTLSSRLVIDRGNGYAVLPGSQGYTNAKGPEQEAYLSTSYSFDATPGNKIKIQLSTLEGNNMALIPNQVRVIIREE